MNIAPWVISSDEQKFNICLRCFWTPCVRKYRGVVAFGMPFSIQRPVVMVQWCQMQDVLICVTMNCVVDWV